MTVLVKDNSGVLKLLKVGDLPDVNHYSSESAYPSERQKSAARHITWSGRERLRGHYLIGLEMMEKVRE